MFQDPNNHSENKEKTILLLAECWVRAMDASRFVARMLFDDHTKIVILTTYQRPATGTSMIRSITPILEQAAEKDLLMIEEKLINEYHIPAGRIEKRVVEGNIQDVIKKDFNNIPHLSVVLGQTIQNPFRKGSCLKIVKALVSAKARPIFLISDFITLIEGSRISLISEREESISELYINYLRQICPDKPIQVEVVTRENENTIKMDQATTRHLANHARQAAFSMENPEQVFMDLVVRPDAACS